MATTENKSENESESKRSGKLGCLVIVLVLAGAVAGVGLLVGRKQEASMSPCERYVTTMARALDNCSSGQNRNHAHLMAICERSVNPTPACLERIDALPCAELEQGPAAAGDVCRKK